MKQKSLADISYEDALQLLYLRKQAYDAGTLSRKSAEELAASHGLTAAADNILRKEAKDPWYKGITDSVGNFANQTVDQAKSGWKKLSPEAQNAITTGGVGAGLGMTAGFLSGDKRKKNRFRNTLMGGLAGGAVGGGLGLALQPKLQEDVGKGISNIFKEKDVKPGPSITDGGPPVAPIPEDWLKGTADKFQDNQEEAAQAVLDFGKANPGVPPETIVEALLGAGVDPDKLQSLQPSFPEGVVANLANTGSNSIPGTSNNYAGAATGGGALAAGLGYRLHDPRRIDMQALRSALSGTGQQIDFDALRSALSGVNPDVRERILAIARETKSPNSVVAAMRAVKKELGEAAGSVIRTSGKDPNAWLTEISNGRTVTPDMVQAAMNADSTLAKSVDNVVRPGSRMRTVFSPRNWKAKSLLGTGLLGMGYGVQQGYQPAFDALVKYLENAKQKQRFSR